jgi:hypothetical protein
MPLPLEAARPTAIEQPAWRNSGTYSDRLPDRAGALKNNQTAAGSRSETHPPCPASTNKPPAPTHPTTQVLKQTPDTPQKHPTQAA